ncbi:uncharacterized protein [Physcomitrium patens]|uniref:protein-tyrosine-phosphatase n=1 Tax=Physcomitrium patens TaxID=3218 RepID=A0A2K1IHR8_PHYPA|nr:dual specificity protein phosphatase 12-like [Physcomitrium patens]XP_024362748.1 dual specificity protein phosphatase 12-like [Physcomitrium patens]PNR28824.1 hypothetical protein PHYPA_027516 [Physcomitrium patens]|eukprot:XP_024362747.1 dual specificity protein phosphatase 12-like [Physcomitrella patens]
MKKVRDRLYIGNIKDAAEVLTSAHPPVTHMLSLITPNMDPLEFKKPTSDEDSPRILNVANVELDKLVKKIVPIRDIESQNLLDHLEGCLDFIEQGRDNGSILVHCVAGVSRSAAVITAYLMRLDRLSLDEALASLQQVSSKVYPNCGFMQQLQLFEEMGYVVDRKNLSFKRFHLENLGEAFWRGEKIENPRYAADPGVSANEFEEDVGVSSSQVSALYSCKKCKRVVACQENVISHGPASGESPSRWRRRGARRWGGDHDDPACTSIFVEPMQWMNLGQDGDGVYEGKLQCLNCESRLGNFNWAGIPCSCGKHVKPAFQLHKCNIDSSLTAVEADASDSEPMRYSYSSDSSSFTATRHCGHLLV